MRVRSSIPCTTPRRPLDLLVVPAQRDRVTPERHADPEGPLESEEVCVVHAGEEQRVGAFGRETMVDVVGQCHSPLKAVVT